VSRTYQLDWRPLSEKVRSFLAGSGGVLHLRHTPNAPQQIFADLLRERWVNESGAAPRTVVTVDPNDWKTHYSQDLARLVARKCDVTLPEAPLPASVAISIGDGNKSRGTMNITNNQVTLNQEPESREQMIREVEALNAALQGPSATRLIVLFLDCHSYTLEERKRLNAEVWVAWLETAVQWGTCVIHMFESDKINLNECGFPSRCNLQINLADDVPANDVPHVLEDLVEISRSASWYPDDVAHHAFAKTLLTTSTGMNDLHARLHTFALQGEGP
jgi:hypothetical protein